MEGVLLAGGGTRVTLEHCQGTKPANVHIRPCDEPVKPVLAHMQMG